MVGSTALSGTVDPELLGALIRRYQDAVAGAIGRFGGFVAKFMGDGVLAYFGFPRAFEDAAERAIRAAIDILAEVAGIELPDGTRVQARVGIATGLVVVGEIVGTGSAQERAIVGETPNLAARLQALATPDTILISEATQNLLGGLFELESTGAHALKGFARPVSVWRVVGEAAVESRFAASRAGRDLPMVGRAHEMGLMLDRWRLARGGEGQIVTVIGEAGIGKSRAIEALRAALAGEPHARIHLQGSPYYSDSALFPVIKHVSRAAHFAAADPAAVRIEKLRAAFAPRVASDAAALPLLAELLSIPADGLAPPPSLTPAQRKAATIALLVDEIVRLGETDPVLLVLEDAHWVDASTLELMMQLTDSIGGARLLAVVTARPEFTPPWQTRPHSTLLTLGRLGRADCARLVAGVAASQDLSAETVAAILDKTDGIPLFAEELTRSMVESAGEAAATVPATLKDLLMARLDRLGAAREVAQIAAVVGRQFPFAILDAVVPRGGAALEAALTDLVAAGILLPEGRGLERGFSFKHALLRDAAYDSLLLTRRREWHERTAHAVEERFPELAASEPEVLAYHFAEAGLPAPACDYRMRAGDRAASRSAYREAVANFSAGLKAAEALPASADRTRRQLDFLLKLGPALIVTRGMGSPEVEDAYRRAAEMGEATGDEPATFKAKWGLWLNANIRRKTALARDRADELLALAQRSGDGDLMLEASSLPLVDGIFPRRCRGDPEGLPDRQRNLRHRPPSPSGPRLRRSRSRCLRGGLQRHGVADGGGQDRRGAGRCARTYPRRSARPSQYPRSCPAQYRHRPPVGRRPRCRLCGREPGRSTGAKVRADAMARRTACCRPLGRPRSAPASPMPRAWSMRKSPAQRPPVRCRSISSAWPPRCCWAPGAPPMRWRISTAPSPASTSRGSAFMCRKSTACAANACWRSTGTTKMKRGRLSSPPAILPFGKAR